MNDNKVLSKHKAESFQTPSSFLLNKAGQERRSGILKLPDPTGNRWLAANLSPPGLRIDGEMAATADLADT